MLPVRLERLFDTLVFFLLIASCLALGCWFSFGRPFWSDELFGWMLVSDPSFAHMLKAWRAGADGGGIGFYLLARLWIHLFGGSDLACRLFSACGVGLSAAFTYLALRRFFPRASSLFSVALVWFSSTVLLWQMKEARFYGLLLAGVGLAVYLAVRSLESSSARLLLSLFLAHTMLVATHPFGTLYSASILAGMVVVDASRRRFRAWVYATILAGWWPLALSVTAMRNTAAVGRPTFWTYTPRLRDLRLEYVLFSQPAAFVLVGALVLLAALWLLRRRLPLTFASEQVQGSALLLITPLLLVPVFVFAVSRVATSVFVDRYLCPLAVGYCFVLTFVLTPIQRATATSRRATWALLLAATAVLLGVLPFSLGHFQSARLPPFVDPDVGLLAFVPKGLPVLFERCDTFDQLLAYHRDDGYQFLYLLDWGNVLSPGSPRMEPAGYHEMENWRSLGYFSGSILPVSGFFPRHAPFIVVDEEPTRWFDRRLSQNAGFELRLLGTYRRSSDALYDARVWLVQPRPGSDGAISTAVSRSKGPDHP